MVLSLYRRMELLQKAPSDLMGIHANDWVAWMFDSAVIAFGRKVDSALDEAQLDVKERISKARSVPTPKRQMKMYRDARQAVLDRLLKPKHQLPTLADYQKQFGAAFIDRRSHGP